MIKFIEKTDLGLLVLSPMRLMSPIRFCAQTEQQAKRAKSIEWFILLPFFAYCLNMYRTGFDGLALFFGFLIAQASVYLGIWIFVSDLEIYDESKHGAIIESTIE